MKTVKVIIAILASVITSCNNFEEINTNSDSSTNVKSSLLATGAIMSIVKPNGSDAFFSHLQLDKYVTWGATQVPEVYNSFGRESFAGYSTIKDCALMAELASIQDKDAYQALSLFIKSVILYGYTHNLGDIPYTDILKGKEGILKPTYTPQSEVLNGILNELENSYTLFCKANDFEGDPIFNGNVEQWAKVVSVFEMRVLMELSKREKDENLKVKDRFKSIYKSNKLMKGNEDNLQLTFSDKQGQLYPVNNSIYKAWEYPMLSSLLINLLKENKDSRLFYFADPVKVEIDNGTPEDCWEAYYGVDVSQEFDKVKKIFSAKKYSPINRRYTHNISGEPFITIGYVEQNFLLAEAALRGWISEDVDRFYKEAIKASMEFVRDNTPDKKEFNHGVKLSDEVINSFLNSAIIQLTGEFEKDLRKIIEQKYISMFMQTPYLPYYDYRRTGYPDFPINENTNLNFKNPTKIPVRWLYPSDEFSYNKENVEKSLETQYGGIDDVNNVMWMLK